MQPLITFQNKIGYTFLNQELLRLALTHKSYAFETGCGHDVGSHNERLEFLGDAVLDLIISHKIMEDGLASEGDLSKKRAALVNEKTLSQAAREINLNEYIILGKGETQTKGMDKDSILSSTFEAVIGAIYLDGGYKAANEVVLKYFDIMQPQESDYKTRLQEKWQAKLKITPQYVLDKAEGPDHQKTFFVSVYINENKLAEGVGKSRKEAEQNAALIALMENKNETEVQL
ncbi:MAG: ribonuclease III [Oligoflexia bacterium]|nr:ribonuclease III [Oligoflexia bacterium]